MNYVVIGLGSMGKRRVRLLKECLKSAGKTFDGKICGVDNREDRRSEAGKSLGIQTEETLEQAVEKYHPEVALICTAPLSHAEITQKCLELKLHVFTEINIIPDGYEDTIRLAEENHRTLFLSSTPMFRREMRYIFDVVEKQGKKLTYRYHVGQYLPEWHPWENYRDFFVGEKRTNGCRELFAIELPWMVRSFGGIEQVYSLHEKISGLQLDYDDTYQVLIRHASGIIGNLCIDVVTPKAGRNLEIWGEGFHLQWNGTPEGLVLTDGSNRDGVAISLYEDVKRQDGYASFVIEDAYAEEIRAFLSCVEGGEKPEYTFEQDAKILQIIDRIEA